MSDKKPPTSITVFGRLSFPVFSYNEAVARNQKSDYPAKDPADVTPEFNLLLEQAQYDKLMKFVVDDFIPHCAAQFAAGEKRNALEPKDAKKLLAFLEAGDWDDQPPYVPFKTVPEKTAPMAPEAVVMIKIKGNKGVDIEQRAVVMDEDELVRPDSTIIQFPVILPVNKTVHQLYPGCIVGATLNLYSFISANKPGFSASAGVVVFKMDADRFGGGVAVDEDAIFADG